nr:uncharacterized protein LOC119179297 [Rhipicephalus microplus]
MAGDSLETMTSGTPFMPATSRETLYLVGYSSKLKIYNVVCVLSRYLSIEGEWVKRSLNYMFRVGTPWRGQSETIRVKWEPYAVFLHVKPSDYTKHDLHAKTKYVVRTFGKEYLLLSEITEGQSPCALWVTKGYQYDIPETINKTFHRICPDPLYVPYEEECIWNGK